MEKASFGGDLTSGGVKATLFRFAMPFLFAQLLQAGYSVVDMVIAGSFMGDMGIAAINNSTVLTMFISIFISGFAISGTVLVAQYVGAKDQENAIRTIGTLFTILFWMGVVITVLGFLFGNRLLVVLRTPQEAYEEAGGYLRICFFGTLCIAGYNGVSAVLRGLGDSKRPLYFVAIATVINICLDILFMGKFHWGARGAAWATIIAQGISFLLAVLTLVRGNFFFTFSKENLKIDKTKIPNLVKIGLPSAVQSGVINLSFIFLLSQINAYGLAASTAAGIGSKLDSFAILPSLAFSQAVASMVGQNLGAREYDRARETYVAGMFLNILFGIGIFLFVRVFDEEILSLFRPTKETIELGRGYIRLATYAYLFNAITFPTNGLANGSGNAWMPLLVAVSNLILTRLPLVYFFATVKGMGLFGIFLAMGMSQMTGVVISVIFYWSKKWRRTMIAAEAS